MQKYALNKHVSLIQADINSYYDEIKDDSIDFVHLDISNDGNKLKDFVDKYYNKLKQGSIFVFEGGSHKRDEIEWMIKYNKEPIQLFLNNSSFKEKFNFFVLRPFPSITICEKI